MKHLPQSVQRAIDAFAKLPGIGPKTAGRLVFHLIRQPTSLSEQLGEAIGTLRSNLTFCPVCFTITDQTPCVICADTDRDQKVICVVEQPLDTVALEATGFRGRYHVLGGAISPIDGIHPEQLRIRELPERLVSESEVRELILATNSSLEGEATALYIQKVLDEQLQPERRKQLAITRIAHGLPVGSDLEYADAVTLSRALEGRRTY